MRIAKHSSINNKNDFYIKKYKNTNESVCVNSR